MDYRSRKSTSYESIGLPRSRDNKLEKKSLPVIFESSDAIIKVLKTTICGTDLHIIIENSLIKYSQAGNAKLSPGKEYCHISITDNCIGFEPKFKEHIFKIFKRLHDKQNIAGKGIGLAIVKKL